MHAAGLGEAVRARGILLLGVIVGLASCHHRPCSRIPMIPDEFIKKECVPHAGDPPCPACLREWCCVSTLKWANYGPNFGVELGACVEAHCDAACTRPQ